MTSFLIGNERREVTSQIATPFVRLKKNSQKSQEVYWFYFFRDMRTKKLDLERAHSFADRGKKFMEKLKKWAGGASTFALPYLHIMLSHIGDFMIVWGQLLGWGYGYFSCTAGEHLNKRIKVKEISGTNLSVLRFADIIRDMRIKQFFYMDSICKEHKEITQGSYGTSKFTYPFANHFHSSIYLKFILKRSVIRNW